MGMRNPPWRLSGPGIAGPLFLTRLTSVSRRAHTAAHWGSQPHL